MAKATKTLKSEKHDFVIPFEIHKTSLKVRFYDYDTRRTLVRTLWEDCIFNQYVYLNKRFVSLSMHAVTDSGIPFTINEYVEC